MAVFNFQKPDKVIMIDSSEFEGKFEFRPLEPGYGLTIGNALRRVLLSSLEGFAFTSVRLDNIDHEFSSLPGIVEDVTGCVTLVCIKSSFVPLNIILEILNPNISSAFLNISFKTLCFWNKS